MPKLKSQTVLFLIPLVIGGFFTARTLYSSDKVEDSQNNNQEYFLVGGSSDFADLESKIKNNGGQVKHKFGEQAGIAEMKPVVADDLRINSEVSLIASNVLEPEEVAIFGEEVAKAAETWNYAQTQINVIPTTEPAPVANDALTEPDLTGDNNIKPADSSGGNSDDTSEFLLGDVSVGVFLVESNGIIDAQSENWSSARETQVYGEIQSALDF